MRTPLSAFAIAGAGLLSPMMATGQECPVRPLRIVAPFPPGGGVDFLARILGQKMTGQRHYPGAVCRTSAFRSTQGTQKHFLDGRDSAHADHLVETAAEQLHAFFDVGY